MENYILNCYFKWLKQRNGTIFKQLSKLTMTANVLIVLLFMLFILFVLTILAFYKCVDPNVIYTPMILEIITGIVSYIYIPVDTRLIRVILICSTIRSIVTSYMKCYPIIIFRVTRLYAKS